MIYLKLIKMFSFKCKFLFYVVFYLIATSSLVYTEQLDEQSHELHLQQQQQQEEKLIHQIQIHPVYPVYHHYKVQQQREIVQTNTKSHSVNENLKIQTNDNNNNEEAEDADDKPTLLSSSKRSSTSNTEDTANMNKNGETQQVYTNSMLDTTNYVATTPANLQLRHKNISSRLEDSYDDEDDLNAELNKQSSLMGGEQTSSTTSSAIDTILSLIGMFMGTGSEAKPKSKPMVVAAERRSINTTKENLSAIEASGGPSNEFQLADGSPDNKTDEKSVGEGRYIKGDPINGYYDFVITEGSYKFWAAFQLATAALIIYSTLAAIYYSKVNPLVSDYEYVDYLSRRSFDGRSMTDDVDFVGPDDEDNQLPVTGRADDGNSYWSSLVNSNWLGTAVHGFQFVLDAIDKVPQ